MTWERMIYMSKLIALGRIGAIEVAKGSYFIQASAKTIDDLASQTNYYNTNTNEMAFFYAWGYLDYRKLSPLTNPNNMQEFYEEFDKGFAINADLSVSNPNIKADLFFAQYKKTRGYNPVDVRQYTYNALNATQDFLISHISQSSPFSALRAFVVYFNEENLLYYVPLVSNNVPSGKFFLKILEVY